MLTGPPVRPAALDRTPTRSTPDSPRIDAACCHGLPSEVPCIDCEALAAPAPLPGQMLGSGDSGQPSALAYRLDWHAVFNVAGDQPVRWQVEDVIEAGRLVSIYSAPKAGKSLLLLDIAAALATGRSVLGAPATGERVPALYCDFENTTADVVDRLRDLGYRDPDDLAELHYLSLPTLPPLDQAAGGQVLLATALAVAARVVIIDTTTRTTAGDENSADTWARWYRCTALPLKREDITVVRLDHAGKDASRGQRGSSSKSSDVDVVYRLTADGERLDLVREHARQPHYAERVLVRRREVAGVLRHERLSVGQAADAATADLMRWLDAEEVPRDAGRPTVQAHMKARGKQATKRTLEAALRLRKMNAPAAQAALGSDLSAGSPSRAHPAPGSTGQSTGQAPGSTGQRFAGGTGAGCPPQPPSIEGAAGAQTATRACCACGGPLLDDFYSDGRHPTCTPR